MEVKMDGTKLCPYCLCGSTGEMYGTPKTFLPGTYTLCARCFGVFDHHPDWEILSDRERKDLEGKMRCETCGRPGKLVTHLPGSVFDVETREANKEPIEAWACSFCPGGAMKEYIWGAMGVFDKDGKQTDVSPGNEKDASGQSEHHPGNGV